MTERRAPGLLVPAWGAPRGVRGAFTLRTGGCSEPPCDSLNLALHVGDDPAAVLENRRRVHAALELPGEPLWLAQVHGAEVLDADREPPAGSAPPVADAAVTRRPGVVLAILVADCLPVLLAGEDGRLGVAHAGWRGLAAGVLERTVEALGGPAARLVAWIGPGIGVDRFEVGGEVRDALLAGDWGRDPSAVGCFRANAAGRWQCDLAGLAVLRLRQAGIGRVSGAEACTAADPARFFSHRRDGRSGRMAALLWREPARVSGGAC